MNQPRGFRVSERSDIQKAPKHGFGVRPLTDSRSVFLYNIFTRDSEPATRASCTSIILLGGSASYYISQQAEKYGGSEFPSGVTYKKHRSMASVLFVWRAVRDSNPRPFGS